MQTRLRLTVAVGESSDDPAEPADAAVTMASDVAVTRKNDLNMPSR